VSSARRKLGIGIRANVDYTRGVARLIVGLSLLGLSSIAAAQAPASGLAAPTALAATGLSNSQIELSWTASTAAGASTYSIERCAGASCTNFTVIGSARVSPYIDGGLSPQTTYRYRIRAQDGAGGSSDYVTTSASTLTLAAPSTSATTGSGSASATYVYDSNGHLLQVVTSSGTTTYIYDAAGHVVHIQSGP